MSSAFVKEGDAMWLRDISPTLDALINYLSKENGLRISVRANYYSDKLKAEIHKMSDGFEYMISDNKWVELD